MIEQLENGNEIDTYPDDSYYEDFPEINSKNLFHFWNKINELVFEVNLLKEQMSLLLNKTNDEK